MHSTLAELAVSTARRHGYREEERRAASERALDPDVPAVCFDESLRDRETQTRTSSLTFLRLPESLEYVGHIVWSDSSSRVGDAEQYLSVLGRCTDSDRAARLREFDRVAEEILEDLVQAMSVGENVWDVCRDLDS